MNSYTVKYDDRLKIWSGGERSLFYDYNCSIGKIMYTSLRNWPDNVCQIFDKDERIVTNAEALSWAVRIAQYLKKNTFRHNDVIGISAMNSTYVMPVAVGCLFNATPFHSVNPTLETSALGHCFAITKPRMIFCDGADYDKICTATKDWMPEIYTLTDHIEGVPKVLDLLRPTETELFYAPEKLIFGGDQTMAILCSSGTTGMPKAVCISNNVLQMDSPFVTSKSVVYAASGLDWITGIYQLLMSVLNGATRIISNKTFNSEHFIEMVKKYKMTLVSLPPRYITTLLEYSKATPNGLESIQALFTGGGFISKESLVKTQKLFKSAHIVYGYGFTEASSVATGIASEKTGNSVGKLNPGIRARIVDDNGQSLGHNQVGEIYVHTGLNWNGYYGNPIETQRIRDYQGWFHTGDIGYFDEENNLYIVDRKKEILKYQGMHYWPNEIEKVIAELPGVVEVCVVGIYNERFGDLAGALVIKNKESKLTEIEIKDYVAQRLVVNYKQLHAGVIFVDQIPESRNGKVLKTLAKDMFKTPNIDR